MKKSMNAGLGVVVFVLTIVLAGCAGGSTQQLQMSGVDPDYPHAGVISGEDGKGLIYSSDWKRVKEDSGAPTVGETPEEQKEFEAWKADKDYEEFQAWKKAQQEQQGSRADGN